MRRLLVATAALLGISVGLTALAQAPGMARAALQREGYAEARTTGLRLWAPLCSGKVGVPLGFTAVRARTPVTGYVCANPMYTFIVEDSQ